jgi:hypothetical protein
MFWITSRTLRAPRDVGKRSKPGFWTFSIRLPFHSLKVTDCPESVFCCMLRAAATMVVGSPFCRAPLSFFDALVWERVAITVTFRDKTREQHKTPEGCYMTSSNSPFSGQSSNSKASRTSDSQGMAVAFQKQGTVVTNGIVGDRYGNSWMPQVTIPNTNKATTTPCRCRGRLSVSSTAERVTSASPLSVEHESASSPEQRSLWSLWRRVQRRRFGERQLSPL